MKQTIVNGHIVIESNGETDFTVFAVWWWLEGLKEIKSYDLDQDKPYLDIPEKIKVRHAKESRDVRTL